jgi:hypothetical protein
LADNRDMERDQPWDARMVKWMSRGSDTARNSNQPVRVWVWVGVIWAGVALLSALFGSHWIAYAALAAFYFVGAFVRRRRVR